MTDQQKEPETAAGKDNLTGRLEKDGRSFAQGIKAAIRSGGGISFVFPSNQINEGDKFRFLAWPDRVIEFEVDFIKTGLGLDGDSIGGRITRDDTYPVR